jgi:hypothetical protein
LISCPECHIGLPDDVKRCPVCQRLLFLSPFTRRVGLIALIMMPLVLVLGVAMVSHRLESKLLWHRTSASDAYRAALAYMASAPDLRGAVNFSNQKDSVIERWGPLRFRVAGYVDLQPEAGARTHNSYSCVLHYTGADRWEVEDLRIERVR